MGEILATVAMDLPQDPNDLAQVPRESIAPLLRKDIVLAQYSEYADHYRHHFEANPKARKVPQGEDAPTLGFAKLSIPTKRWSGVHFGIVHAKGVDTRKAYVRIALKAGGELLLHIQGGKGNEFISTSPPDDTAKMAGWQNKRQARADAMSSNKSVLVPDTQSLQAYEVLLGDALQGDQSYFVTFREVIAGYKAWDAVMGFVPITSKYPLGTTLHQAVQSAVGAERAMAMCSEPAACVSPVES